LVTLIFIVGEKKMTSCVASGCPTTTPQSGHLYPTPSYQKPKKGTWNIMSVIKKDLEVAISVGLPWKRRLEKKTLFHPPSKTPNVDRATDDPEKKKSSIGIRYGSR
jgi:hypothetical protein